MKFLDQAKIFIQSGHGGPGCLSFRREKYVEFGGPDGGNGGRGGDVIAEAVGNLNTLIDFRYRQHFKARAGMHGMGSNRTGADAPAVIVRVPTGTQILSADRSELQADLAHSGARVTLARGGIGGRGNAAFKSAVDRAPRHTEPGREGQEMWVWLRLKLIADIGLVGLPNAGKSTFLAAVSRARPKIANYPFTTLHPGLGVAASDGRECVIADIPGLIAGAHAGRGLGDRFLGHIERCRVLLHLIDIGADDPAAAYATVRRELEAYGHGLADKPERVVLTKADTRDMGGIATALTGLAGITGGPVAAISAHSGAGLAQLLRVLLGHVASGAEANPAPEIRHDAYDTAHGHGDAPPATHDRLPNVAPAWSPLAGES